MDRLSLLLCVGAMLLTSVTVTVEHITRETHNACSHQIREHHEVFYDVYIEPDHVIKKRSVDQPLRIHLHYDDSLSELPPVHMNLIKTTVREAVRFWESSLRVRATGAPIRLRKQCSSARVSYKNQRAYCVNGCAPQTVCGDIVIPDKHLEGCFMWDSQSDVYIMESESGLGINNTDFILYVAAVHSDRCRQGSTVAYAAHCQQERGLDRPVAGYFSICPDSISVNRQDQLQLLSTMKHEILHALGFTAGLYAFYRDEFGNPLTNRSALSNKPVFNKQIGMYQWSEKVVKKIYRNNWKLRMGSVVKSVDMVVTPNVKREVRKYFNCSTLEGAELEDQGIDGTALTHWEKRIFENEAMTGTYTQNSVISRITLAMMEDTGWYKVKYENAGNYEWGKNLGCDFVFKSCYDWIESRRKSGKDIYPYCEQIKQGELWTDCTNNRHSVALCNLVEYTRALAPKYQYFNSLKGIAGSEVSRYGGSVQLADYCPYLQEFSWTSKDKVLRGSSCLSVENNVAGETNFFGEKYGNHSRCFNHAGRWFLQHCYTVDSPQHSGSGCYEYTCSPEVGLIIHIAEKEYRCHGKGQVLNVAFVSQTYLHKGSVICPSCQEICDGSGVTCPSEQKPVVMQSAELMAPCGASSLFSNLLQLITIVGLICPALVTVVGGIGIFY